MIVTNRKYPFGTRIATIVTPMFVCKVSTAKEGLLQKQSTMVFQTRDPNGTDVGRTVAKITYSPSLRSSDRLQMHELISTHLDVAGETQSLLSFAKVIES